ncbi:CinA family protein [Novosphingobium aquimarinum]|uniref:CinA family protein n=1 Tax=Novosphingobium aquimarinum TaxID=2682494 RepID=UPI0012ECA7A7|nr:CinA family protein [Novosphingobium aquimarinum]
MTSLTAADVEALAIRVVTENAARGRKVALAESCTGGLVCGAITEVPGSSAVLDRGFVTYSNESKEEMLDVPADLIEAFGAVSPAVAWAMAQGALKHSSADVAVAISGVAGPDGGTDMKPVGTVVFACAFRGEADVNAEQRQLDGNDRAAIRRQATVVALELLLP